MQIALKLTNLLFFVYILISCQNNFNSSNCNLKNYSFDTVLLYQEDSIFMDDNIHFFGGKLIVPLKDDFLDVKKEYSEIKFRIPSSIIYKFHYHKHDIELIMKSSFFSIQKDSNRPIENSDIEVTNPINYFPIGNNKKVSINREIDSKNNINYHNFIMRDSTVMLKYFFWRYKNSLNYSSIYTYLFQDKVRVKWGSPIYNEIMECSYENILFDFSKERVDTTELEKRIFY